MTDAEIVARKLATLRDHAARVRRRRPADVTALAADQDLQDALCMSLLVSVERSRQRSNVVGSLHAGLRLSRGLSRAAH
jgi:hypothetical protein